MKRCSCHSGREQDGGGPVCEHLLIIWSPLQDLFSSFLNSEGQRLKGYHFQCYNPDITIRLAIKARIFSRNGKFKINKFDSS